VGGANERGEGRGDKNKFAACLLRSRKEIVPQGTIVAFFWKRPPSLAQGGGGRGGKRLAWRTSLTDARGCIENHHDSGRRKKKVGVKTYSGNERYFGRPREREGTTKPAHSNREGREMIASKREETPINPPSWKQTGRDRLSLPILKCRHMVRD